MPNFKTIHTTYGLRRMAEAEATGKPINLTFMAVGDGGGTDVFPDPAQTQLVREIADTRRAPNRVYADATDPTMFTAELIVPADIGGFTIREFGVYDDEGGLFAVGNLAAVYKPKKSEGSYTDAVVRVKFAVTNAQIVNVTLDPNVATASQAWVLTNMTPARLFPGGTTGQVLRKRSNAEGDAVWGDAANANVVVSTVEEELILAEGQTTVDLGLTTTYGLAVYIAGERLPKIPGGEGWQPDAVISTKLLLGKAYPAGTRISCVQNEPASHLADPLEKSKNLSDIPDKATARSNLEVLSRAESSQLAPVSQVAFFARSTAPSGWLKANGAAVSRTAYPELFAAIGTAYGGGDGFNTFNLPDIRGDFIRAWDDGRGVDAGRALGSTQAGQLGAHVHNASSDTQGGHTHTGNTSNEGQHSHGAAILEAGEHQHDSGWGEASGAPYGVARTRAHGSADSDFDNQSYLTSPAGTHSHGFRIDAAGAHSHTVQTEAAGAHAHKITIDSTGGAETRPRNTAFLACIKYA